ncbi:MAG: 30S ribosomal protein S6 modification protein RimK [Candidatus Bathyarchaeota archaeon B23]|nr:MAG: 30S ribosomal protein S6 modification protein RimK [Candidatus Bathyarchaeota archaeon B23]
MRLLILYGRYPSPNSLELAEVAERRGHQVLAGSVIDVSSQVSNGGSRFWLRNVEVTDYEVCLLRSFGPGSCEQLTRRISLIEHMELSGIRVMNPCYPFRRARDKYATQYILAGAPIAETYTTEDLGTAYRWAGRLRTCIYKPILGHMGRGSMKFDDPDLAYNALKSLTRIGEPLILQEYLQKPGRDVRVFVVGEEVVGAAYKYGPPGSWKTNVAQGGRMVAEEVPGEILELGVKAVKALGLDYAGVDVAESERGPVILEVNGAPGWQALKRATGVDIAGRIIEYVEGLTP